MIADPIPGPLTSLAIPTYTKFRRRPKSDERIFRGCLAYLLKSNLRLNFCDAMGLEETI
jgi:hypothetical protein